MSSVLLTPAGQTGFNGTHSFKPGAEMDIHFVIYNLAKDVSGLEQRVTMVDEHARTLMSAALPLATDTSSQLLQGTRLGVPTARGRYGLIVTLQGGKGRIDLERRADFVVE